MSEILYNWAQIIIKISNNIITIIGNEIKFCNQKSVQQSQSQLKSSFQYMWLEYSEK